MSEHAWRKIKFNARDFEVGAIETLLEDCGALAVTTEARDDVPVFDTLDEPSRVLWPQCAIEALFAPDVEPEDVINRVGAAGFSIANVGIEWLADRAWHLSWRDQFKTLCFAERLWIVPSWHQPPPEAVLVITLDPGMAFGTGTHQTTGLCLEWLASWPVQGRVLDYGCGSGILAIAAAKLGAAAVAAVDIDPEACRVTRENAELNDCSSILIGLPIVVAGERYDLVVANLLLRPVLSLQAEFVTLLAPGGRIVLSGIMADQVPAVLQPYAAAFDMDPPKFNGEWAMLTGILRGVR